MPYRRPPLSKEYLTEGLKASDISFGGLEKLGLELKLATSAVALDAGRQCITLADGQELVYDGLAICTGSVPIRLSGLPVLRGVHYLRTVADATAIREEVADARVVVVGAGFVGCEIASSVVSSAKSVCVIETEAVPLSRVLGAPIGGLILEMQRRAGVDMIMGSSVAGLSGRRSVDSVVLGDGSVVPADVVIIGVGVAPCTMWLKGSGLPLRDGVVCDANGTVVEHPAIAAVGDVARRFVPALGKHVRLEHYDNAIASAGSAASALLSSLGETSSTPSRKAHVPYFWSAQHGNLIQMLGYPMAGGPPFALVEGDWGDSFVAVQQLDDRPIAALFWNRSRSLPEYRRDLRSSLEAAATRVGWGTPC
jgi:NADPH-dependent 2,4-dienoyl-CoA reductase/sulfur reductase-like enzyme